MPDLYKYWEQNETNFLMKQLEDKRLTLTYEEITDNFIKKFENKVGYKERGRKSILDKIYKLVRENPDLYRGWTQDETDFLVKQLSNKSLSHGEIIDNFIKEFENKVGYKERGRKGILEKIYRLVRENPDLHSYLMTGWTQNETNFLMKQLEDKRLTRKEITDNFIKKFENKIGYKERGRKGIERKMSRLVRENPDLYRGWTQDETDFLVKQLSNKSLSHGEIIDNFIKEFENKVGYKERGRKGILEKIYRLVRKKTSKNNLGGNINPMLNTSTTEETVYPFNNSDINKRYNSGSLPYQQKSSIDGLIGIANYIYNENRENRKNNMVLPDFDPLYKNPSGKRTTTNQKGNTNPMSTTSTINQFNNYRFISNNNLQQNMNQGNSQKNYDSDINIMVDKLTNPKRKRTTPKNNQTGHRNSMLNTITNNKFNISQSNNNGELLNPKRHKGTTNIMSSQTNTTTNRTGNKKNNIPPYNNTLPSYNNGLLPYQKQLSDINDLIGMASDIYNKNNKKKKNENGKNENDNMVLQDSDPVNRLAQNFNNSNYNKSPTP